MSDKKKFTLVGQSNNMSDGTINNTGHGLLFYYFTLDSFSLLSSCSEYIRDEVINNNRDMVSKPFYDVNEVLKEAEKHFTKKGCIHSIETVKGISRNVLNLEDFEHRSDNDVRPWTEAKETTDLNVMETYNEHKD